jgi:dynein heavy chain
VTADDLVVAASTLDTAIFEFSTWGKSRDYPCILNAACVAAITEKLDEDQMTLAALNAQRHVAPFKPQVEQQIRIFSEVGETLDMWVKVQQAWTSLETVFTGGDIARQMPVGLENKPHPRQQWLKLWLRPWYDIATPPHIAAPYCRAVKSAS